MNIVFREQKNRLGLTLILFCIFCSGAFLRAATRYVVEPGTGGTNEGPYTDWTIAATQIQWAVAAAESNTTIWVSNGTYVLTNQVATIYGTNITIRSVNGCRVTIVDGNREVTSNRCFDLYTNATLDGFTVRNGCVVSGRGGGIRADNSKIYNCRIENNICSNNAGGGISMSSGQITNCQIVGNVCTSGSGGGIYAAAGATISGCEIASNAIIGLSTYGSGVRLRSGSIISNCIIYANTATNISDAFGGGVCTYESSIVRNSLIYGNRATSGGGGIFVYAQVTYSYEPKIQSCTVVSNYSPGSGGGIYISGSHFNTSYVENTILYYNSGNSSSNLFYGGTGSYVFANSCIAPTSAIPIDRTINTGNIQNDPNFVNYTNGDCHLKSDSPCINAGTNQSWMTNAYGLGRVQRIRYGTVDMGAFERVNEGTVYTVH